MWEFDRERNTQVETKARMRFISSTRLRDWLSQVDNAKVILHWTRGVEERRASAQITLALQQSQWEIVERQEVDSLPNHITVGTSDKATEGDKALAAARVLLDGLTDLYVVANRGESKHPKLAPDVVHVMIGPDPRWPQVFEEDQDEQKASKEASAEPKGTEATR
jgi:hypothetical protein